MEKAVGKGQLIEELAAKLGKTQVETLGIYNSFVQIIDDHLKKEEAVRLDIGILEVKRGIRKFYAREKGTPVVKGVPAKGRVIEAQSVRVKFRTSRYKRFFADPASVKPIGAKLKEGEEVGDS
jgi:nucleoid DNA-binding protein